MGQTRRFIYYCCFFLFIFCITNPVFGQDEFHNFPIKVGKFQPVDIKFDDEIVNAILPCKGMFELERSSNGKAYTIISQRENDNSSCFLTLVVGEGRKQRKHSFEILYEEEIPEEEMVYDFTDSKKLKEAIKDNDRAQKAAKNKPAKTKPPVAKTAPEKEVPVVENTKTVTNTGTANNVGSDQSRKDSYYKAIGNAELALNSKDYAKAEQYYNQAKQFEDPGSTYVQSRLIDITAKKKEQADIEKKLAAEKTRENNYKTAITAGDIALGKADYDEALLHFRQALTYKEQDTYANKKIIEVDALLAKKKQQEAQAAVMAKYNAAKEAGDRYFKNGQFDRARGAYTEALQVIPGDAYASNQLKNIQSSIAQKNEIEAQKERQKNYDENILIADGAFQTGDYKKALENYGIAEKWKPSETYPVSKINEIKKLQTESAAKAEQERVALEKQKKLDNDYAVVVKKADELMNKRDLSGAEAQYEKALSLKPYEEYPKKQVQEIKSIREAMALAAKLHKDSIDAVNAKRRQYDEALARGKKAFSAADYPGAKAAYAEAQQLFAEEKYPAEQIARIDQILADLAAQQKMKQDSIDRVIAFNKSYDSILVVGANAMLTEDYDASILAFRQATELKPEDVYAKNLLRYVTERKSVKASQMASNSVIVRREQYREVKKQVIAAMREQRYLDAQVLIKRAESLMDPGEEYGTDKEYYENRLGAIDNELSKAKANGTPIKPLSPGINDPLPPPLNTVPVNTSSAEIRPPVAAATKSSFETIQKSTIKTSNAGASAARKDELPVQAVALPYNRQELWKRYPGVNFMEPPPGQGFNVAEFYDTSENARLSKLVLNETDNRVNISDTQNGVTLTLEGISFSGTNAFYRLRLQNKSNTAFAAGVMSLVWQLKDQSEIRLYPGYVSSFPLLLPQKEIIIIYVAKSAYVDDAEQLVFSLRDRTKVTRLSLPIPGTTYNQESNR